MYSSRRQKGFVSKPPNLNNRILNKLHSLHIPGDGGTLLLPYPGEVLGKLALASSTVETNLSVLWASDRKQNPKSNGIKTRALFRHHMMCIFLGDRTNPVLRSNAEAVSHVGIWLYGVCEPAGGWALQLSDVNKQQPASKGITLFTDSTNTTG